MIFKRSLKKKIPVERIPKNKNSYLSCVMVVLNEVKMILELKNVRKPFKKLILKLRFLVFHKIENSKVLNR